MSKYLVSLKLVKTTTHTLNVSDIEVAADNEDDAIEAAKTKALLNPEWELDGDEIEVEDADAVEDDENESEE